MSKAQLREELDAEIVELNDWHEKNTDSGRPYDYSLGTHASGLAIDLTKNGGPMNKVMGQFCRAAMRAGYVVTGTLVHDENSHIQHTRIFLGEADDHFDIGGIDLEELRDTAADDVEQQQEIEDARAEGFVAGLFFAGLLSFLDAEK